MFNKKDNKINLTFTNYDNGIFFDEKNKRFVDFSGIDLMTFKNYKSVFNNVSKHTFLYL